ncbi:MAG TPA: UDP-N-acetylmuramate dehydrogenase [Pelolinea sp.]|nr:UDP-N-acetylmuramate dehydrogenase [Pelolinea sp.]
MDEKSLTPLRSYFGSRLQENVRMANFTTMNVGGPADALLIANSADQLAEVVGKLWEFGFPVKIMGSGSNVIISDRGIRSVVVINHAHNIRINIKSDPMTIWAESGALMINIGKKLALWGLKGMEWAATIPGSVGGAVYGNAGAFGGETCRNLISADMLHRTDGRSDWECERLEFTYRASNIKRDTTEAIILSALFSVEKGDPKEIAANIESFKQRRWKNQPPGASVGSVFRNPPEDKAGRLIEAVGLKGKRIGGAVISDKHANFIINDQNASAQDVFDLLVLARNAVEKKFGIGLIPEIEVIGDWDNFPDFLTSHAASKAVK